MHCFRQPFAAKALLGVLGAVGASTAALALLESYVRQKAQQCGCDADNLLFHYTTLSSAAEIYEAQYMFATNAYPPDYPEGAYASDIAPWDPGYSRTTLAQTLYFNPARQESAVSTTGYFVTICNDLLPRFAELPAHPRQWVKSDADFVGLVAVHAIFWGANPMPK